MIIIFMLYPCKAVQKMAANVNTESLTDADKCGIYLDEGEATTLKIENILSSYKKVLLVCGDAHVHSYTGIRSMFHLSVYEIIRKGAITDRFQVQATKFAFLALFGYISIRCFEYVIVRLSSVEKNFACCFRQFCAADRDTAQKWPRTFFDVNVCVFLKEISRFDTLLLGLRNQSAEYNVSMAIENVGEIENGNEASSVLCKDDVFADCSAFSREVDTGGEDTFRSLYMKCAESSAKNTHSDSITKRESAAQFRLLVVEPAYTPLLEKYLSLKILLKSYIKQTGNKEMEKLLKEAMQIECTSFGLAFELIRTKVELKCIKSQSFREAVAFSDIQEMLVNEMKFQKTMRVLEETESNVFLVTNNKNIFGLVKEGLRARLLDPHSFTHEELAKMSGESTLLFYDYIHTEMAEVPFRVVVVIHLLESSFDNFLQIRNAQNKIAGSTETRNEMEFVRRSKEETPCFFMKGTGASVPCFMAHKMLTNFLYLLKNYLDEHMLFIRDMAIQCRYEHLENGFVCIVSLPYLCDHFLFTEAHASGLHSRKKSALDDISAKLLVHMHDEGFVDNNFFPTEKFVSKNKVYNAYLRDMYGTTSHSEISKIRHEFHSERAGDPFTSAEQVENLFRRKYALFLNAEARKTMSRKGSQRKCPKCLLSYPKRFHVYAFCEAEDSEQNLGICCGASFEEDVRVNGVCIKYLYSVAFTLEELEMIFFFQVLFFGLHFKKTCELSVVKNACCYLVVPLSDGQVDIPFLNTFLSGFMKNSVYEETDESHQDYLVFNPITKMFFTCHNSDPDSTITEKVIPMQGRKFFAKEGITGHASYAEYFEKKYNVELLHKHSDRRLLFRGGLYTSKGESQACSVMSSEIMCVTRVRKDLCRQYARFVNHFVAFEAAALAFDLKIKLGLKISIEKTVVALTPKGRGKSCGGKCYERYEFLGDSILKYIVIRHLFLANHAQPSEVARVKDSIVCNANLQRIAERLGIPEHVVLLSSSENQFRPPDLFELIDTIEDRTYRENMRECISYFRVENVFHAQNSEKHSRDTKDSEGTDISRNRKVYADILEAIIGMYMLENDLESASEFIYDIGILTRESLPPSDGTKSHNKVLEIHEISLVEQKLGYIFKQKGLLEKAIIHPSSHNNIFGSTFFQSLELLGDCSLELLVTQNIFHKYPEFGPGKMNAERKSLVNNFSLARALFHIGLVPHIHTCFPAEYMLQVQNKIVGDGNHVNKLFGDIFEAICGAVLVDMDFDMQQFAGFMLPLVPVLEECADHTK